MTTKSKLEIANWVCAALFITAILGGIVGQFMHSVVLRGGAACFMVAGIATNILCYRLQARLNSEKRKKRTENTHESAAVGGHAVPDDEQLALDVTLEVFQEIDHLLGLDRTGVEAKVKVPPR